MKRLDLDGKLRRTATARMGDAHIDPNGLMNAQVLQAFASKGDTKVAEELWQDRSDRFDPRGCGVSRARPGGDSLKGEWRGLTQLLLSAAGASDAAWIATRYCCFERGDRQ